MRSGRIWVSQLARHAEGGLPLPPFQSSLGLEATPVSKGPLVRRADGLETLGCLECHRTRWRNRTASSSRTQPQHASVSASRPARRPLACAPDHLRAHPTTCVRTPARPDPHLRPADAGGEGRTVERNRVAVPAVDEDPVESAAERLQGVGEGREVVRQPATRRRRRRAGASGIRAPSTRGSADRDRPGRRCRTRTGRPGGGGSRSEPAPDGRDPRTPRPRVTRGAGFRPRPQGPGPTRRRRNCPRPSAPD